jgi:hypothetical protein
MFGLKEERKRAAGEEEMSLMERGGVKSSNGSKSGKDLGWNGSAWKSGWPKGWTLTKIPRPPMGFSSMSSQGGSGSGEMESERDASARPRIGSELAKT